MGNTPSSEDVSSTYDSDMWHDTSSEDEGLEATEARLAAGATTVTSVNQTEGAAATEVETKKDDATSKKEEKKPWKPRPCGFEAVVNDEEWETWEGPQRIKTCKLDYNKQQSYRDNLDILFSRDTVMGKKVLLTPEEIADITLSVIPYLESEPCLIEDLPYDIVIVGDLHGQLYDLDRVFKLYAKDGKKGWECMKFLFLGDYVDRGRQSSEIVLALFMIKMLHPDQIFLLRGNHEFIEVNMHHGFAMEVRERYDKMATSQAIYNQFNEAFSYLSLAAIVGNSYFAAHGGISPAGFTRRQLRGKYKPIVFSDEDIIVNDLVWSDPAQGLKGSTFNKERGQSCFFGYDELCLALERMDVAAVFRGHTMMKEGYGNSWNVCFTIFTATDYLDAGNKGAVAHVDAAGKVRFTVLDINKQRSAWERKLRLIEYKEKGDGNEKTVKSDAGSGYIKGAKGGKDGVE